MRIVICHNYYQQAGGEDRVFADEAELLASRGHEVVTYTKHNDDVINMGRLSLAMSTVWNRQAAHELKSIVRDHRADIVHFHNTLPLMSPAVYYAARKAGAAVVQTLHNYRFACPKATLFRNDTTCELCVGKFVPWPAIQHSCYRENRSATVAIATMLTFHRLIGTYRRAIDAYIALSGFSRDKLVEAGLPAKRMHQRPNYMISDPGPGPGNGGYAFYLGRLSPEKGVHTLLEAWRWYGPGVPLMICGNGPLAPLVQEAMERGENVTWYPDRPYAEVLERLGNAAAMILPSTNYEGFPKTIVEAYSKGTPVIASRLGAMAELIREGETGACFKPGDAVELAATVRRVFSDQAHLSQMRINARRLFESEYTEDRNYERLMEIYREALCVRHGEKHVASMALPELNGDAANQFPAELAARDLPLDAEVCA